MRCTAHTRSGAQCSAPAVTDTTVCRMHGGSAPQVLAKAQERSAERALRQAATRLGVPVDDPDPAGALLGLIAEAAGNVEFYRSLVEVLPTHPEPDEAIADGEGNVHYRRGETGVYGRTYHQSGIPTGEAKAHVLVQLYDAERDRLAKYVKDALQLGLDERRVRIAESDARRLFTAVVDAMADAGLSEEQGEAMRRAVAARLRAG